MEDKKYYWIKLKTDFFNQDAIDFLMSQENGCEYIVLYQMLCLQTANTKGVMAKQVGEMIVPYDAKKISRDTRYFDIDTITVALELYKRLGLIYQEQDGTLCISDYEGMIGSETKWAEKKRIYRKNKGQQIGQIKDNERTLSDKSIEIRDRDKSIEKDTEIDKEIDKEKNIIDYQGIIDMFNNTCISLPKVTKITEGRKLKIKARLKNFNTNDLQNAFIKAEQSDFLSGRNGTWKASFDWFFENDSNITKVLEGNYDNNKNNIINNKPKEQMQQKYENSNNWLMNRRKENE